MATTVRMPSRSIGLWRSQWDATKPFRFLVVDDFLDQELAEAIYAQYPKPDLAWNGTTFKHQRKKYSLTSNFPPRVQEFFDISASPAFLKDLSEITGIPDLRPDPKLFGGGCHQSANGGFLDVHVDYNFHPDTHYHRRLNLIVYMNKDWKQEYGGYLELWDMQAKKQIANVAPVFNRMVMFETNEISYHGHPVPLTVPEPMTRRSLAVYYYTETLPEVAAPEHNTRYINTTGLGGAWKVLRSGVAAFRERALKKLRG